MKYVQQTKAAKSVSAYLLMRGGVMVGKILVHHGDSRTFCNVWLDDYAMKGGESCLYGSASGYGYNKENAAISHAIDNIALKAGEWDAENNCRKFDICSFNYAVTSRIGSHGPRALEDLFSCTVLQAI